MEQIQPAGASPFGEASARADSAAELGQLLRLASRGDQQSFAQLYDATSARVFGLAVRIVRDPAQAEEVAQEAFLEIWRTASRFDPAKGSAEAWMLTIVHRSRSTECGRPRRPPAATLRTSSATRRSSMTRRQTQHTPLSRPSGCATRWRASRPSSARRSSWPTSGVTHTQKWRACSTYRSAPPRPGSETDSSGSGHHGSCVMTDVHALSGAYAIDALDDLERAKFERHLSECQECQAEVASLREASALLAALAETAPPRPPRVGAGRHHDGPADPAGRRRRDPAGPQRRRWQGLLVAAAAVTVLGSGRRRGPAADERRRARRARVHRRRADPARQRGEADRAGVPGRLQGDRRGLQEGGQGGHRHRGDGGRARGSVYQLWYSASRHGPRRSDARGSPMPQGSRRRPRGPQAVGITVEPEGSSPRSRPDPSRSSHPDL